MKKIIISLCVFLLLVLSINSVSAQAYQIYVSDINTTQEQYTVGSVVEGTFKLSNLSEIPQSDIYYTVASGQYSEETLSLLSVQGATQKQGPFYIKNESQDTISFKYTLPVNLSGKAAIQITATLKDGTQVGQGEFPISIVGSAQKDVVSVMDSVLTISDFDAIINPQTGPTVYEGESIDFSYALTPSNTAMVLTPVLKLYDRVDNADELKRTVELDPIEITNNPNIYTISLPTDLEPLVYYGVVSFKDENNRELLSTSLRYIIAGPIATVRNITTDTLEVDSGDTFSAVVSYGGQPFDEYRPEKQITLASTTITVTAKNEKGEEVANVTQLLDLNTENKTVNISMIAQNDAESLTFSSVIRTQDGKVLDEYSTILPTEDAVKNQKSLVGSGAFTLVTIMSILILLLLIILAIFLKKKYKSLDISMVVIAFGILGAVSIFGLNNVSAGITEGAQKYLDDVTGWDDEFINSIMGWKVVQSYRTKYDKESEDYGEYANFQITSVSSPLPPKIKIYEPGEKFTLNFNAVYGDCNNEGRNYAAFAPDPGSKWWNVKPKVDGDINERYSYWKHGNSSVNLLSISNESTWKQLFLATDLQPIGMPGMSVNKEKALKEIVKKSSVEDDIGYLQHRGWIPGKGINAKLYRFADDGEASKSDYVEWAKNNSDKAESVKNTFVALTSQLDEYPKLSKFDFTKTGQLKASGNEYTDEYIDMLTKLNNRTYEYTKSPLENFKEWFTEGKHDTELTPVTITKVYTAPQEPGFHKIYFYMFQHGNSHERDITAVQVICVRGAGKCPNENKNTRPVVTITNVNEIKATQAKVNWSYIDKEGDKQVQYTIQVSTQKSFVNPIEIWSGVGANSENNNVRSKVITGLRSNTTYYVKMRAKSDSDTEPYWSNWTDGNYSFTTAKSGCDDSHYDGEIKCIDGKEYEYYCEDTTWKTRETGNTCGNSFSCSAISSGINTSATFTAKLVSGATYQWYLGSNPISGANSNIYKETFKDEGQYTRKVKATYQDNTSDTTSCTVTVTKDGNPPGGDNGCVGNDCDDKNPPNGSGENAVLKKFEFNPNTVSSGDFCGLYAQVENTTGCRLERRGDLVEIEDRFKYEGNIFEVTGNEKPIGTYTLYCKGTNNVESNMGTKSCYSNPDIREN